MNIDNGDAYFRIRGVLVIVTIFFSTLIGISILYDVFPTYLIPMSKTAYALTFAGFFVIYLIYRTGLKYHFIIYNDEADKIILRHYALSSFNGKHVSIEIPFDKLYKIEIQKAFFNFREELVIYQSTKGGIAKYKPISLSALQPKEKAQLIEALNKFARVKMQ